MLPLPTLIFCSLPHPFSSLSSLSPGTAGLGVRKLAAAHGGAVPLRTRPFPEASRHETRERRMCLRGRPHIRRYHRVFLDGFTRLISSKFPICTPTEPQARRWWRNTRSPWLAGTAPAPSTPHPSRPSATKSTATSATSSRARRALVQTVLRQRR